MVSKELTREAESAERMAGRLSAHCMLFDGFYNDQYGIEQANLDPEAFFISWNEIHEKVDELYGALKGLVSKFYETKEVKEEKGNE